MDKGILSFKGDTTESALRRYSAHLRHLKRFYNKAAHLYTIVKKNVSLASEMELSENLCKAEEQIGYMGQIIDWLTQQKYAKVADHEAELADYEKDIDKCWSELKVAQGKRAAQGMAAVAQPPQAVTMKPVSDLKPEVLEIDSSASYLRVWIRKFEAYHSASNMTAARISDQHAYLVNCLGKELGKIVSRDITDRTPIFGNDSCISLLQNAFARRYPTFIRRKTYFEMRQDNGQDKRSFLEAVLAAADEADIAGMTFEDSLCLVLLSGVKDKKLQEKMSEVAQPTLAAFTALIDSHIQSKAASASASSMRTQTEFKGKNQGRQHQANRKPVSEEEQKRRKAMIGKCFRCASPDHTIRACTYKSDVQCHKCKKGGHIAPACNTQQARHTQQSQGQPELLQLEYQQDGSAWAESRHTAASQSKPTPRMLL
jgi:hypothetical protein